MVIFDCIWDLFILEMLEKTYIYIYTCIYIYIYIYKYWNRHLAHQNLKSQGWSIKSPSALGLKRGAIKHLFPQGSHVRHVQFHARKREGCSHITKINDLQSIRTVWFQCSLLHQWAKSSCHFLLILLQTRDWFWNDQYSLNLCHFLPITVLQFRRLGRFGFCFFNSFVRPRGCENAHRSMHPERGNEKRPPGCHTGSAQIEL